VLADKTNLVVYHLAGAFDFFYSVQQCNVTQRKSLSQKRRNHQ